MPYLFGDIAMAPLGAFFLILLIPLIYKAVRTCADFISPNPHKNLPYLYSYADCADRADLIIE